MAAMKKVGKAQQSHASNGIKTTISKQRGRKAVLRRPAAGVSARKTNGGPSKKTPANWARDYPIIQELRKIPDAPVDSVGCERLADPKASKKDFEWQCLVAAMLSSQTKDQMNAQAMVNLNKHGNSVEVMSRMPVQKIDKMIKMVGFHSVKAKNVRAAANIILKEHGGRVPRTLEGLMELPGVGPKMAYLTLHAAFDAQVGLCVDVHVHRIANVLGWIRTKTPEESRQALEAWLPKQHWDGINILMVGLGQQQQQQQHKLVEKCLASTSPVAALRLVSKIGITLRADKFPDVAALAKDDVAVRRLMH